MVLSEKPYVQAVLLDIGRDVETEAYPFNILAVKGLGQLKFHPDITLFVGENGAGKSTILEALALALGFSPEGGTKNFQLATTASTSELHRFIRLVRGYRRPKDGYFLRAESFFNVATYMDEVGYLDGYGGKSLHARSHGESFMTLLTHKFRGNGLYLLDEPEAALSPARQLAVLAIARGDYKPKASCRPSPTLTSRSRFRRLPVPLLRKDRVVSYGSLQRGGGDMTSVSASRGAAFVSAIAAMALVVVVFAAGVFVGQATKQTVVEVKVPSTITLDGIPSNKADCLQWAVDHMQNFNAGIGGMLCNGERQ